MHLDKSGPAEEQQIEQAETMQPRKLNWTKVLFDYHICMDAEAFEKWDGDLTMINQEILEKDLPRTRCTQPNMMKESFRNALRRMTTFYCKQNGVNYQQGLLQVAYPFALLRRRDFKTKKCYAYFNAFMRKHFPKVLVQRVVEGKKELPHAILAITLTQILLRFHYPSFSNALKQQQIPMSLIATQELLTIFAKNLPIKFVYEIYDYFIQKNNSNFIFYMMVALIGLQVQALQLAAAEQVLAKQVQNIKKISSMDDIKKWFKLAQQICKTTPLSFQTVCNEFCFSNRNLLSAQDVDNMLKSQEMMAGVYMPISIQDIDRDPNRFVIILLQSELIRGDQKYQSIKLNLAKLPPAGSLSNEKIYVLAAHQNNLEEEQTTLTKWASSLPNLRFVNLREHLIGEKHKKCSIF